MRRQILIQKQLYEMLTAHLFQGSLEEGAFLFCQTVQTEQFIQLVAKEVYLVPPNGWAVQLEVYLEMKDCERSKIMKMARNSNLAVIDCHSHPGSDDDVAFSPSDKAGITDFARYAQWKLDQKPFAAIVWGEKSVDAIMWDGTFQQANPINEIRVGDLIWETLIPRGTWFPRKHHLLKEEKYGR